MQAVSAGTIYKASPQARPTSASSKSIRCLPDRKVNGTARCARVANNKARGALSTSESAGGVSRGIIAIASPKTLILGWPRGGRDSRGGVRRRQRYAILSKDLTKEQRNERRWVSVLPSAMCIPFLSRGKSLNRVSGCLEMGGRSCRMYRFSIWSESVAPGRICFGGGGAWRWGK